MSSKALLKKEEKINLNPIEINTLLNPLSQGDKYQECSNNENYEAEKFSLLKNRQEKNEKEKEYNFKEKIIYNSLPTDYINQSKSDSTNIYYFEKFFEQKQDFDYTNYTNLINMRAKYLSTLFKKSIRSKSFELNDEKFKMDIIAKEEEKEEKKDIKKEEEKKDIKKDIKKEDIKENVVKPELKIDKEKEAEKKEREKEIEKEEKKIDENELKAKDALYSLLTDLAEMMNYQQDQGDQFLYYSIVERIFSNIFFEIETFFNNKDLNKHSLYELKLYECIDLLEKNILSKDENINNKTIHFLYQLQKISLSLQSCGVFLKILKLMKSKNIVLDNYNTIYDKYFKFDIANLIKEKKENNNNKIFEIAIKNDDIKKYEFCIDDKYLYLCYHIEKTKYFKLGKYDIVDGKKLLEKEFDDYIDFSLLNDYKNNKINILLYKSEKEFELLIINKNNLLIEKKFVILSPIKRAEYLQVVTSLSYFYLISVKQMYILKISNINQTPTFNPFYEMKRLYTRENSYYFIMDEFIEFSSCCNINLAKKAFADALFKINKENERYYFDNFNNKLYNTRYIYKKKLIEIYAISYDNFKLKIINSNKEINEINEINNNIDNSLQILKNKFPKKEVKKNELNDELNIDPFKYYLEYNNNLESILNKENKELEIKYKTDKDLSEKYYSFLYYSLCKYYYYSVKNSNEKNNLILNINNDIMINFIKEFSKEQKYYILLYIYTSLVIQENKNKKENNPKLKWIVDFCIKQQEMFPFLFEILREIYKYEPKYIHSLIISKNIISSNNLSINRQINFFSIIDLNEKKDLFNPLLEKFLSIEKSIILSGDSNLSYSKVFYNEISHKFIKFFTDIEFYDFKKVSFWKEFQKILEIFLKYYNSILTEMTKPDNKTKINQIFLKDSIICQVLFLLINILLYKIKIISKYNYEVDFIKLLLKTLIISQKYSENEKNIEHNIENEEVIIVESQSNENSEKTLPINEGIIYMEYDLETNYPHSLTVGNLPPFTGSPSEIEQKEYHKDKKSNIYLLNKVKDQDKNNNNEYKRYKIKFSNYTNDESKINILIDIRKSILFFILNSIKIKCNIKNIKQEYKKENEEKQILKEKINKIIKSEYFKDISIIPKEKNSLIKEINYFDFNLDEIVDNKLSEEYNNNYIKKINSLYDEKKEKLQNNNNIIYTTPSINSIIDNLTTNDSYKNLLSLIHKEFIKINPWGTINESLLKNIISNFYGIILYEFNLYEDFDELVQLNKKNKLSLDNEKLNNFISIYTKINQIRKYVSQKKQDFSILKNIKEKDEELFLKKYIYNINDKMQFIIDNKKRKDDIDIDNKKYNKIENIEKVIGFLIDYLVDDKINKSSIQQGIEDLNENLINKERNLNYLNKILYISNKTQDIKDLISSMNSIIKNGKTSFNDFDIELLGADDSLIDKYKKQVFIYILQIINKIKNSNNDNNNYDISYYFSLLNSLFCPFKKKDYKFIEISEFYNLLNYEKNKNKYNDLLLFYNSNNSKRIIDDINILRFSYDNLYKEALKLFKLMTFLAINQFNNKYQNEIPLIKYVFDIMVKIFTNYIDEMNDFKNKKKNMNEITNEERLNTFLVLFYRCIVKMNNLDIITKYYNNIITVLFHILNYSSSKNKIISLKIIEILLMKDAKLDELYLKNNIDIFKKDLEEKNLLLYKFIYSNKVNHIDNIFVEFLFNFVLLLQQNIDNIFKYINSTENNMAISLTIIKMIQNKLLKNDNSIISQNIIKFIQSNYNNPKFLTVILQIIGIDLSYLYIGADINLDKGKKGIILGFSNIPMENEAFTNYSNLNFCKGEYVYYIKEDNIFRDFLTNLDLSIESIVSNNVKVLTKNSPILPLEKNKMIYEYLIENLNNYEEKDIYFILRYIKIFLIEENIKLNDKIISYIMEKSLNKDVLEFESKIVTLEKLEKLMIPYICESNPKILFEEQNKVKDKNTNVEDGEPLFVDPYSPDIFMDDTSFYYRCAEEHMLGFNYQYKKIFNYNVFTKAKKFLKVFNKPEDAKKYKENCILMTKNLLSLEKLSPNVKYILISDSFNEEDLPKNKILSIPIIMIDGYHFNNIYNNNFENNPYDELQDLYLISLQTDASSLIDIPFEKIPEFSDKQRDTLLDILNEEPNEEPKKEENEENNDEEENYEPNYLEFKNIFYGKSIHSLDKKIIINKLIALICRRLAIIVKMVHKIKIPVDDLKKLVKLLLYESLGEISNETEIVQILKSFVIVTSFNNDIENIKCFTDISFLDNKDLISDKKAKEAKNELELLTHENLNNNIFLIDWFFLCQYADNKTNILDRQFVMDYLSKLINLESFETSIYLLRVFKHIEKDIDNYTTIIYKNRNAFCSKELLQLFDSCEKSLQNQSNTEFNKSFYEKIELFFTFFNIAYKLKINYNINLDTSYYENSLLLNIYKIVSLLLYFNDDIKSEANYSNFVELCYQKGIYKYLIDCDQFSKPLQRIKLNYYDKTFNSNFVMNFQNLIPKNLGKNVNSISLILRGVDDNLINPDNCAFIYESEKCQHLQDYIKKFDRVNDKRILLLKDNFTISYPNKNFFSYLYGAGYNDKNSLGIQIGNREKFSIPQPCVGLEECKNIIDFKFGYYHTFVQTADGNLLTCGADKGSSFKTEVEYPFFNKQTYFYILSKDNGGIKTISANNFNSSILLTNNNKLFCCGKNNTNCLGNTIPGEGETDIPIEMPEFLPLFKELKPPYIVKEIACGYKSTLFLLESGYAFTCGSQDFSQCGSKDTKPYYREYFPLYPPRGTKFTHVVAGEEFFLFLVEEINEKGYGKLYSLGQNEFGRSGTGELNFNYTLQRLEEVEDKSFTVISSRNENAAAISTEGELYTFGNNASYALGLGHDKNAYVPTKVQALNDYICDSVGISQHHMIVIARRKDSGKRVVLSCGNNQFKALCTETENENVKEPTETKFFLEQKPDEEPIRASLSRYQTYLLSLKVDLRDRINKILTDFKCVKCNKDNQYCIYFSIDENNKVNYYCKNCAILETKKIFYSLNTIEVDTKNNLEKILNDKDKLNELKISFEKNKDDNKCSYCSKTIIINTYQSYSNEKLMLCENCYMSKCPLIEYPQLFISYNSDIKPIINKKTNFDSILYPNIFKTEKPYLEFDVVANYKKEYIIKELYNNKQIEDLYKSTFKLINKNILKEMIKLKEFYEENKFNFIFEKKDEEENKDKDKDKNKEEDKKENEKEEINKINEEKKEEEKKDEEKKEEKKDEKKIERKIENKNYELLANIAGKSNKYLIYEIIKKLIEQRDKSDIKNQDFKNIDLYKNNNKLFHIAFELSNRINNQIFKLLDISIKFQFPTIFRKVIENSLQLIASQERKKIFQSYIDNKRVSINAEQNEITISRIKANLFYAKNELDKDGTFTVFSQLYRKTRNYPKKNYLSQKNNRLFSVKLKGEGASDLNGVYNEIISIISFELESKYLDLFIKTPNNKNEIGQNRDKYIPNPLAKSNLQKEMYYFIGNLMLHAITSGNVLNLNLHPIFYKKLLNSEITFKDIETLDKLSYKFITSLELIKEEKEFNEKHPDLFFAVHSSSDNSLIDLIKDGQYKKVTFDKLSEYIKLYKEFLIKEIDEQVSLIRKGIFDILDENLSILLTPQDLEEYICGKPYLDLKFLRERTRYDGYESDSPEIINFWKALESFSEEEKSKYLRFVSGRSRMPDPRNITIDHKIQAYNSKEPDKRMPTSATCYFTLSLPKYSTYEILRDKLRYVINNCSSIDADFFPEDGGDAFNEE